MNLKQFFTKYWPHFAIVALMTVITCSYFSLQFSDYGLKQHDIEQFSGAAHEISDFREKTGEETLWTNSMFGGMPSIQISVVYAGNFIKSGLDQFLTMLPPPAGITLLYMLGFYVLAICLRINPWVGFLGAIAFGFASYDIIIIQAGHNTKALAVAFMAPVVGSFFLAYQRNIKWGAILSALFMTLEMSVNHLQVTYYLGILLIGLGLALFVDAFLKKNFKHFFIATAGIVGAYALALMINYGNIALTNDYSTHSIRGANDITMNPDGTSNKSNATTGLDKDYVTQYSNGIDESFTILSPYIKGSAPGAIANTHFSEQVENMDLSSAEINDLLNSSPSYWGDQPQVSGPAYIGIIVIFLALLGMVFLKTPVKWALLGVTLLALALSWGKNFMGLTDFFLDNVPGYNKFRAPTIIIVVVELCLPILGVLFLNLLYKEKEALKEKKKLFLITSAAMFIFLLGMKFVGLGDGYTSKAEKDQMANLPTYMRNQVMSLTPEQMAQYQIDPKNTAQVNAFIDAQVQPAQKRFENLQVARKGIFDSSMNRSILFLVLAIGAIAIFFYTQLPNEVPVIILSFFILMDLVPVDRNYLGSQEEGSGYKYWDDKAKILYPIAETPADLTILDNELAESPALKAKVDAGLREGKAKADELGYEGEDRRRVENAYKFAALNRNTNFRVFDLSGGFNSSNAAYFHKSLGGYHGAKLRNIQNVFDYHLMKMNNKVYDMLNVKYFMQQDKQGIVSTNPNPTALGNAWMVRKIATFATPDDEIRALGNQFDLKNIGIGSLLVNKAPIKNGKAYGSEEINYVLQGDTIEVRLQNGLPEGVKACFVMDVNGKTNWIMASALQLDTAKSFLKMVEMSISDEFKPNEEAVMLKSEAQKLSSLTYSGEGTIQMTSYAPNKITYQSNSSSKQFAVFSEVYYPEGWTATVNGKEVEIRKTNYLLRGIELPAGNNKIVFSFNLPKFDKSNTYARIGGIIIVLLLIGGVLTDFMKKRKAKA
jgi:hypothetical protein